MSINLPGAFKVLDRAGLDAILARLTIGQRAEWEDVIDNTQHQWGWLCRNQQVSWYATPDRLTTSPTSVVERPLLEHGLSSTPRLIVPVELGLGRYGQTGSLIDFGIEHEAGTLTVKAENEARTTTYGTTHVSGSAPRVTFENTISLTSAPSNFLFVAYMQSGGSVHAVYRAWVQVQEILLSDL